MVYLSFQVLLLLSHWTPTTKVLMSNPRVSACGDAERNGVI